MKKRKIHKLIYFLAFLILIVSSCAPAYVANVINTPLLSNKGEIQAAVYTGTSGFDPQFSYAISDHIGLMINGSFENRTSDSTENFHKHQFVEIGSGYYNEIGRNGRFEVFGGLGSGKLKAEYSNNLWKSLSDVSNTRVFIQPSIGVVSNIFDGSFSSRFVLINLYQGSNKNTGLFVEPAITGKLGFKYLKAVLQLGLSLPVNSNNIHFLYQPVMFSIGLEANLNKIF